MKICRLGAVVVLLSMGALTAAQERVVGGPPPEIKALIEAFTDAFNSGNPERWDAMTKERFGPDLLAKRGPDERRRLYDNLRREFGTITLEGVRRRGPDAPLQLLVKGSTGTQGTIELQVEAASPYRITAFGVEVGTPDNRAGSGVPSPPISGAMSNEEISRALDGYLSKLAADDVFSGVALVAKTGSVVFEKAYGFADRANKVPNTTATRFNLGSINKIFTQTAIEQLIASGKLARTDTVGRLLPDYPQETTRTATIDQLLNHQAGIADFFGEDFSRAAKDRFRRNVDYYQFVSNQKPLFAPGERSQYCNGCYITLGAIIEQVAGIPYERYIEENIFKPAGMKGAGPLQMDRITPNMATGYTRRGGDGGELRSNIFMHGAAGSAAGGGYATAADLLAFDTALKQGKLLDQARSKELSNTMSIAGGAPGINAALNSNPTWTVIVLTNLDPPTGAQIAGAVQTALR